MDCVIKVLRGPEAGQEFRLGGTEAVVGRSGRSQVKLSAPSVSFEHAVVTRNGEDFYIENLSATGTFVNDEKITGKVRLRARDQLRFGNETAARVESVPAGGGAGGRRRMLLIAVVVMVVILLLVVLASPLGVSGSGVSVRQAYPKLDAYVQELVAHKRLPPAALTLLREGWRLEMAKNRKESVRSWRDLNILLAGEEPTMQFQEARRGNDKALSRVARSDPKLGTPTDDEMKAALVQFVERMAQQ